LIPSKDVPIDVNPVDSGAYMIMHASKLAKQPTQISATLRGFDTQVDPGLDAEAVRGIAALEVATLFKAMA
jgi:hypothetical protein